MSEGFIDLQSPHTLIMDSVRGYAPLLPKGPQADRPVRAAWKTLSNNQHTSIKQLRISKYLFFPHKKIWSFI